MSRTCPLSRRLTRVERITGLWLLLLFAGVFLEIGAWAWSKLV